MVRKLSHGNGAIWSNENKFAAHSHLGMCCCAHVEVFSAFAAVCAASPRTKICFFSCICVIYSSTHSSMTRLWSAHSEPRRIAIMSSAGTMSARPFSLSHAMRQLMAPVSFVQKNWNKQQLERLPDEAQKIYGLLREAKFMARSFDGVWAAVRACVLCRAGEDREQSNEDLFQFRVQRNLCSELRRLMRQARRRRSREASLLFRKPTFQISRKPNDSIKRCVARLHR